MNRIIQKHHRLLFYVAWFVLGLMQAIFTELQDDEAYYWVYSKYLDWGYFDHPPMIALLIRIGTIFFGGELAVRIVPLILNTATIYITEKLTEKKSPFLFYAVVLSVAVLQISGFVAVPDIPLMFFTALFFLVYRAYLQKPSWKNILLLGLVAACLLYSKYHAVLIFVFILLSNWKLLKDWRVYIAGLIAFALFLPHLYWQYQHNWISVRYHLFESNVNPYKLSYTTDYVLGQLLIAGPLAGFILWPVAFLFRAKNAFEKSLQFTAIGFFVFFLLSTLKGKVEPNWTSPAIIPLIVLTHQFLLVHDGWRKWLFRLLPVTLFIAFAFRVIMIWDILPARAIVERYHGWEHWPAELIHETGGLPVVFNNSYQRASKYAFYSGVMTYSPNKFDERRNNYNFWPIEDSILGKPVYIMDIYNVDKHQHQIETPLFTVGYSFDSAYHSFAKIQFNAKEQSIALDDSLKFEFELIVPAHYQQYLQHHPEVNPSIALGIFDGQKMVKQIELPYMLQDVLRKNIRHVALRPALPKGTYFIRFGVMCDSGLFTHNSEKIKLTISER